MAWRPHGHARVSSRRPEAWAVCDRCGSWYLHSQLSWQFQFAGPNLQNLRLLVCKRCLDVPQPQLQPRILPPDPVPIMNPRPEWFAIDEEDYLTTQVPNPLGTQSGDTLVVQNSSNQRLPAS